MNKRISIVLIVLTIVSAGCKNKKKKAEQGTEPAAEIAIRDFPSTHIPGLLTEPSERMRYMAENMWESFLDTSGTWLCDSSHIYGVKKAVIEEQIGIYVSILDNISSETAKKSLSKLFDKFLICENEDSSSNVFEEMPPIITKYLYDPNSPVRNEDLYLTFVRRLATSSLIPEEQRKSYEYDARMCALNAVGEKAADFAFTSLEGRVHTLHNIKSPYIILFFSNPGCPSCKDIITFLTENPKVSDMLRGGILAVANIYIDPDLESWRKYADIYPKDWYNGYDHQYIIRTDQIYNVRAIPSLYVLDKDKKVILKDTPQEKLFAWINNLEI